MNNETGINTHTELKSGQVTIEHSLIKETPHSPYRQSTIPAYKFSKSDIHIVPKRSTFLKDETDRDEKTEALINNSPRPCKYFGHKKRKTYFN